jgi:hypothetical protein
MVARIKLSGGKDWREKLAEAGIIYLETAEGVKAAMARYKLLATSRCSKTKTKQTGVPKEFYVSSQNMAFYNWCERHKLRYGILSDEYGIHMDNEVREYYDIHPSKVSDEGFKKLAGLARAQLDRLGYQGVIYFNSSPIMSVPYFYLMQLTGTKVFYITKLHNLERKSIWDK